MEAYRSARPPPGRQGPKDCLPWLHARRHQWRGVTKTVTSTKIGRSGVRMPPSYPAPPAPVPPGVTMATPPGPSAPAVRGACSFSLSHKEAGPVDVRFLSGFFSPFFLIRGGYTETGITFGPVFGAYELALNPPTQRAWCRDHRARAFTRILKSA